MTVTIKGEKKKGMLIFLLVTFALGIFMILAAALFLFFPDRLDSLSNWLGQVIINMEEGVTRYRIIIGIILFLVGAWLIWVTMHTKL